MKKIASIYALKSGKFQVSYIDELTSKRIRRKFTFVEDARRFKTELQADTTSFIYGRESTVGELMKFHLKSSKTTRILERKPAFYSFMQNFENRKIEELKRHSLHLWFLELQEKRNYTERTLCH